jgi:hypothetical protein
VAQGQKAGSGPGETQDNAVAVSDEDMAIGIPCPGEEFKPAAMERMGRIGYFEKGAGTIRVVEGGIDIGYRLTRWIMLICVRCCGSGCETGCCSV